MLYNYRKAILALALVSAASFGSAAMPPAPNYCEHMGYNYTYQENDSKSEGVCKFNENESCDAEAFLEGDCGKEQVQRDPLP